MAVVGDHDPWCPRCEWNLGAAPLAAEDRGWLFRPFDRIAHRIGFRADQQVAAALPPIRPRPGPGQVVLLLLSGLVATTTLALIGSAVWLVATNGTKDLLLGLAPMGLAVLMRPRLGRLSAITRRAHRLTPAQTPALYVLIDRIATATGAPRPDVVLLTQRPAVDAVTVGLRRTRVLLLGMPILIALAPQERVALIGHALGGFAPDIARTRRLTELGRAFWRGLGHAVRPMPVAAGTPPAPPAGAVARLAVRRRAGLGANLGGPPRGELPRCPRGARAWPPG